MEKEIVLRVFNLDDEAAIKELHKAAFAESEGLEEGKVIEQLVGNIIQTSDKADMFGFVACEADTIIGSIFFTRLVYENIEEAFILAPVAVSPNFQKKGIGQKLISFGIENLKEQNVQILFTYGDPKYYSRVGFTAANGNSAQAPFRLSQPEGWLFQKLDTKTPDILIGKPKCVYAFNNPDYW